MEKKIIVCLVMQDFANVMTDIAYAVNEHSDKYEMYVIAAYQHPFNYTNSHHLDFDSSTDEEKEKAKQWVSKASLIIWSEESYPNRYYSWYSDRRVFYHALSFNIDLRTIPHIVFHAGCPYRDNKDFYDTNDRLFFAKRLFSPDLCPLQSGLPLFGKPIPIPIENKENAIESESIRILHSPTNYALKGTYIIREAINKLKADGYKIDYREIGGPFHAGKSIPAEQITILRKCGHIYIDQYSEIGGIGMSSLEALADGLIVLCSDDKIARQTWSNGNLSNEECPIVRLRYEVQSNLKTDYLYWHLLGLVKMYYSEQDKFKQMQELGIKWIEKNFIPSQFLKRLELIVDPLLQDG